MSTPFLGELKLVSFAFAPKGWALCNGQVMSIQQNQALFSLLGTTYGGNGQTTFGLPDLRSRTALHTDFAGIPLGTLAGVENVTLTPSQLPAHNHPLTATGDLANASAPGNALPAGKPRGGIDRYGTSGTSNVTMSPGSVASAGNQPHPNMQPYLVMNWVIALGGIFPSRN